MRVPGATLAGAGLAVPFAAATAAWGALLRRPLPRTRGTIRVTGLEGRVTIRRDRWGVPFITADSAADAWFAQGFCHGQDRLFQMDLYRRIVDGRLAQLAGPAALPADRLMRTLGLRRRGEREAEGLSAELGDGLRAYCAGVNSAAGAARARPLELQLLRLRFAEWTPADALTVAKLLAFGLSTNWEQELMRADLVRALGPERAALLDPRYPAGNPVVLSPGVGWSGDGLTLAAQVTAVRDTIGMSPEATGSNNWAVSGERSATGSPLLAGDPHLTTSMPGIWHQVGLQVGDRWARGCAPPGMPGVWIGQNPDVAWSFTNVMADVMDLFVERVDAGRYAFEDEWRPLERRVERIAVKGRPAEDHEVRETHHGPLVNAALGAADDPPLALRWTGLDGPVLAAAHVGVLGFRSGAELVEGMRDFSVPVSNLVWADRHGDIGYKMVGRIPRRRSNCPDLPKPGWTGEHEWDGTVAYDELPALLNPPGGYVITANNRIAGDEYPHHITSEYLDGYRARRIETLLGETAHHDVDTFVRMQCDVLSIPGLEVARRLRGLAPRGLHDAEALGRLAAWDGRMDAETVAGTIYQAFTLRLARDFAAAVIGDPALAARWLDRSQSGFLEHVTAPWRWQAHLMALWAGGDGARLGVDWDDLVRRAWAGALAELTERRGEDMAAWRWGDVHALEFPHALGGVNPILGRLLSRHVRVGGAQETVNQIAYDPNAPFRGIWAPSYRLVADVGDPSHSRWQAFTGQSGHPGSRHYDDLQGRWLAGDTQPLAGEGPWRELRLEPAALAA